MNKGLIYIHGKGGNAAEADHYRSLFPDRDVVGFDYKADTPWDARSEFAEFFDTFTSMHDDVIIIANSIGAFFALHALEGRSISRAYFISPIADMERLITDMMLWANVTEEQLAAEGQIETAFGEPLSMQYLTWVREHPITWKIPTKILYGSKDHLQSPETIRMFSDKIGASLTIMPDGEHWFHTDAQMAFLDQWISS